MADVGAQDRTAPNARETRIYSKIVRLDDLGDPEVETQTVDRYLDMVGVPSCNGLGCTAGVVEVVGVAAAADTVDAAAGAVAGAAAVGTLAGRNLGMEVAHKDAVHPQGDS